MSDRTVRTLLKLCCWDLDVSPRQLDRFRETMTSNEYARTRRFASQLLQDRAIAARGGLREALSRHLDVSAASLRFRLGMHGKPFLADPHQHLHFNLSHSGSVALLGMSEISRLGVDVEQAGPMPAELLAMLAPAERAAIGLQTSDLRAAAFFDCWTRKEAFVKGSGLGLSHSFDSFDVVSRMGFVTTTETALHEPDLQAISGWRTRGLQPVNKCFAAVAMEAELEEIFLSVEQLL